MKLKNFEDVLHRAPFQPFDIHADGKVISVKHPDQVLFAFNRSTIVAAPDDNRFHVIELEHIRMLTAHARRKAVK